MVCVCWLTFGNWALCRVKSPSAIDPLTNHPLACTNGEWRNKNKTLNSSETYRTSSYPTPPLVRQLPSLHSLFTFSSLSLISLSLISLSLIPLSLISLTLPLPPSSMARYRHRYYIFVHLIIPVYIPVELPAEYPAMELGRNSF